MAATRRLMRCSGMGRGFPARRRVVADATARGRRSAKGKPARPAPNFAPIAAGGQHDGPMGNETPDIAIPADLLPADGRFGCGPSKVRPEAVAALAAAAPEYLGTSHRQATVRFAVSDLRNWLAELFSLPDGYEIV